MNKILNKANLIELPAESTLPGFLERFEDHCKTLGAATFLRQPVNGKWIDYSGQKTADEVDTLAAAIQRLNLKPGSRIAILSKNCAHWIMADLAIWRSGHVSVPLFPTQNPEILSAILKHSEAKMIFVGKLDNWPSLKTCVSQDILSVSFPFWEHGAPVQSWESFCGSKGKQDFQQVVRTENDMATIIYSSGTTGMPKGVVHTFRSINFVAQNGCRILGYTRNDRLLSYLPLGHVVERTLIELSGVYAGLTISFVDSLDTFAQNLQEVQPTMFMAVPRIWTKLQDGVHKKIPDKTLFFLLSIPILSGLLKKKLKKRLGLGSARWMLTGGSPISPALVQWFQRLDILIREGYGLTENLGYAHFSLESLVKAGSVGRALTGVQTMIGKNKEVLLKSRATMKEYYKDPEATSQTLVNDFLQTGDCGEMDDDGFLRITGRIKESFKTSKGKYVSPAPIEQSLSTNSLIENVCVTGSGLAAPVALVTLLPGLRAQKSQSEIKASLEALLKKVNESLENHEKLRHIIVVKDEWSIDNGILTPTLKIRRNELEKIYQERLQNWSDKVEDVYFE